MVLSIYAQIVNCLTSSQGTDLSRQQIIHAVHEKYGTNRNSIIPSDYCYNRTNQGAADKPLFEWLGNGQYLYLGADFPHTGQVFCHPKGTSKDIAVAIWKNGVQTPIIEKSV